MEGKGITSKCVVAGTYVEYLNPVTKQEIKLASRSVEQKKVKNSRCLINVIGDVNTQTGKVNFQLINVDFPFES